MFRFFIETSFVISERRKEERNNRVSALAYQENYDFFFNLLYSDIFPVGLGQKLPSSKFLPVKAQGTKGRVTTCHQCPCKSRKACFMFQSRTF